VPCPLCTASLGLHEGFLVLKKLKGVRNYLGIRSAFLRKTCALTKARGQNLGEHLLLATRLMKGVLEGSLLYAHP
jgi:hypothetical protein